MRLSLRLILVTCALGVLLSACGKKGPLYLPDEAPNTPQKEAASPSNTATSELRLLTSQDAT